MEIPKELLNQKASLDWAKMHAIGIATNDLIVQYLKSGEYEAAVATMELPKIKEEEVSQGCWVLGHGNIPMNHKATRWLLLISKKSVQNNPKAIDLLLQKVIDEQSGQNVAFCDMIAILQPAMHVEPEKRMEVWNYLLFGGLGEVITMENQKKIVASVVIQSLQCYEKERRDIRPILSWLETDLETLINQKINHAKKTNQQKQCQELEEGLASKVSELKEMLRLRMQLQNESNQQSEQEGVKQSVWRARKL